MSRAPETSTSSAPLHRRPTIEVIIRRRRNGRFPSETAHRSPEDLDLAGLIDWAETALALALRAAEPTEIVLTVNDVHVDVPIDTEPTRDGMALYLAKVEDVLRAAPETKAFTSWAWSSVKAPIGNAAAFQSIDWVDWGSAEFRATAIKNFVDGTEKREEDLALLGVSFVDANGMRIDPEDVRFVDGEPPEVIVTTTPKPGVMVKPLKIKVIAIVQHDERYRSGWWLDDEGILHVPESFRAYDPVALIGMTFLVDEDASDRDDMWRVEPVQLQAFRVRKHDDSKGGAR